ncbi:hypothetical protein PV327_009923 [Microctonus hyperodae]|uniref:Peptidase S1 domain-containing protein n=1 Tax=Microctonus hyperodae TaxID=165561 RepID=A0AA39KG44_MICHY|nr:hypothetical protein PV327_009923 [Microctonus hyperodae]
MQLMIVLRIFVSFMATIICAHGSINFKVGVTEPYNHLSQRSSFNVWKNIMIPRVSFRTSDLGDVGLVDIKIRNESIDKDILPEWIQNIVGTTTTTTTVKPTSPPLDECQKCKCGVTNQPNRIVGGHETGVLQYPWVHYLKYQRNFYCAGTIINDRYSLTAAHCVKGFNKALIKLFVGYHSRNGTSHLHGDEYSVKNIIIHSGYSTFKFDNDIALIKIDGTFNFDNGIRPVCLPERGSTFTGENGIVTGWGALSESGPASNVLRSVTVPILSNAECRATKYPSRRITDNMICAGFIEGGKDSCQGDSGGVLHVASENCFKQVGIVSWGEGCAAPGYPGVYTRVNRYRSWIERNTIDSCYCESSICESST